MIKDVLVGYRVEWAYSDGERSRSGCRGFAPDEYDQAQALYEEMRRDPDTVAYLWPIENEVVVTAGASAETRRAVDLCRIAERADGSVFETALRDLAAKVREIKGMLAEVGDVREEAEAEELLTTLQMVRDPDDLRGAGVLCDLQLMERRLVQ